MELNYNQLLLVSLWQYNHYEYEGLTLKLFQETFGNRYGNHYYDKWMHYFNRNLWDMIAAQVKLYQLNRQSYGIQ